jgi:hypothetical protein
VTLFVSVLYNTVQEKFELVVFDVTRAYYSYNGTDIELAHTDNADNSSTIIYCTNIVAAQKVGTEPTFLVDSGRVVARSVVARSVVAHYSEGEQTNNEASGDYWTVIRRTLEEPPSVSVKNAG